MKKSIILAMFVMISAAAFGQFTHINNVPQIWNNTPTYSSGSYTTLVLNSTTNRMEKTTGGASVSYVDSVLLALANSLAIGNPIVGGTTHGILFQNYQDKLKNSSDFLYNNYSHWLLMKAGATHILDINYPGADGTAGLTISSSLARLNRANIEFTASNGVTVNGDTVVTKSTLASYGHWVKVATISYTDFAAAGTGTTTVTIPSGYSLSPFTTIENAAIKATTDFSGGSISNYKIDLGDALQGDGSYFPGEGISVFTSSSQALSSFNNIGVGYLSNSSPTSITVTATSTGGNLDAASAGSIDIYLFISTLP